MIRVNEFSKRFSGINGDIVAVDRVSFTVTRAEVYGLLGPNGAGKTTTIRMILGLLQPSGGDAEVDGFAVSQNADEVKRRIGLVSASAGLYQWLTPAELLLFFADLYGVDASVAQERANRLAELLDIGRFLGPMSAWVAAEYPQK